MIFDCSFLPTPDYYNTQYAADNIQLPITDYIATIWALVVMRML